MFGTADTNGQQPRCALTPRDAQSYARPQSNVRKKSQKLGDVVLDFEDLGVHAERQIEKIDSLFVVPKRAVGVRNRMPVRAGCGLVEKLC